MSSTPFPLRIALQRANRRTRPGSNCLTEPTFAYLPSSLSTEEPYVKYFGTGEQGSIRPLLLASVPAVSEPSAGAAPRGPCLPMSPAGRAVQLSNETLTFARASCEPAALTG